MALPETERVVINPSNSNSSSPLERGVPGIESKAIKTLVMSRNKRGWRRASGQSLVPAPTNKDGIWRDIDENVTFPFWLCTPVVHTSGLFRGGFRSFMAFTVWGNPVLGFLNATSQNICFPVLPLSRLVARMPHMQQCVVNHVGVFGKFCFSTDSLTFSPPLLIS